MVTVADADAVDTALEQLAPVVNRPAVEGTVRFDGTEVLTATWNPGPRRTDGAGRPLELIRL